MPQPRFMKEKQSAMEIEVDLSVCIVCTGSCQGLRRQLRSIAATADPVSTETIVIHGPPTGELARLHEEFAATKFFETDPGESFPVAVNRALRLARGRYAALCHAELVFAERTLLTMIAFMEDHPEAGLVAPMICNGEGKPQPTIGKPPSLFQIVRSWNDLSKLYFTPGNEPRSPQPLEVDSIKTICLVVRREALEDIGLLDELFDHGLFDFDFCRRARRRGWHLFLLPSSRVQLFGQLAKNLVLRDVMRFYAKNWFHLKSIY